MAATIDHYIPTTTNDIISVDYGNGWVPPLSTVPAAVPASRGSAPNFCDTVGCGLRCQAPDGRHYAEGATKPLRYNVDVAMELLDTVEQALGATYLTAGDEAPTAEEVDALGKARRLLVRVIGQLDRAAGGDGGGVPDEDVPPSAP